MLKKLFFCLFSGSVPNSIPRQKAYTYLLLIAMTSILIYFYSYPLNMENWTIISEKVIRNVGFGRSEVISTSNSQAYLADTENTVTATDFLFLETLSVKEDNAVVKNEQLMNTHVTESETTVPREISSDLPLDANSTKYIKSNPSTVPVGEIDNLLKEFKKTSIPKTSKPESVFEITSSVIPEYDSTRSTEVSTFDTTEEQNNAIEITAANEVQKPNEIRNDLAKTERILNDAENSTQKVAASFDQTTIKDKKNIITDTLEKKYLKDIFSELMNLENGTSSVEKGYLVFSENCRIPDIDPWHPSIEQYIDKSPPLDCSVSLS